MHIDDLRALAPLWLSKIEEVRQDKSNWSTNITGDIYGMGWISEMYGYSFGAAEVGLWHKINDDIMIYPGYTPRPGIEPLILHYGLPFKVGNWPFSKLEHHEDGIIYDCNHLFDPPPFPREWSKYLSFLKSRMFSELTKSKYWKGEQVDSIMTMQHVALSKANNEYPKIHTLFSIECSSYFDWQTVGLMYSGQPGNITRLLLPALCSCSS
ncbi:hypothetical protein ZEAMMB73_Zm00001d010484 [Zea mays]|uniref:Hydroxyproline O-arabinosyltransferase-like domain-containing protein n=1 Tax=Zea mays TaxID=4577 RepID=A0A1D6FRB6_MAIZE|nr:hypothetical protein ZEAMMB73_Zm00001d010484 [Zea mays]